MNGTKQDLTGLVKKALQEAEKHLLDNNHCRVEIIRTDGIIDLLKQNRERIADK